MAKSIANLEQILPLNVLNEVATQAARLNAIEDGDEKKKGLCSARLNLLDNERKLDCFGVLVSFKLSDNWKYIEIVNDNGEIRQSTDLKFGEILGPIMKVAEDNKLAIIVETAASGKWSNGKWFDTIAITLS